ncbi:MAG TPA: hypothetical protein GX744_01870, partial [Firmicutes bacterium]|nr:hypothetical protein [Bacillota bacterium]
SAIFIVDCLTLLLSNHLQQNLEGETVISWEKQLAITGTVMDYMGGLAEQMLRCPADVIAVTNEVGWGVTPESVPGRLLLNLAGRANQLFASRADEVWLTICGIARRFK